MGDGVVSSPPPEAAAPETVAAAAAGAAEAIGGGVEDDETVLQFLDSVDSYLALTDSLSSTLRQGWLELASARHSMGSSRISSALLDHKVKSASTTLQMSPSIGGSPLESEPHFSLSKWSSCKEGKSSSRDREDEGLQKNYNSPQIRRRGSSYLPEGDKETNSTTTGSSVTIDNNVQRERMKSLSVFGTLVSPKLHSAQGSFETALEAIVEIANIRSKMLSAFSRLHVEKEG